MLKLVFYYVCVFALYPAVVLGDFVRCSPGLVQDASGDCVEAAVMILGGQDQTFRWSDTVEIFGLDPPPPFEIAKFPVAIDYPAMGWYNDHAIVCGGKEWFPDEEEVISRGQCWEYWPCENQWRKGTIKDMPTNRTGATGIVTALPSNPEKAVFWVIGGSENDGFKYYSTEYYDFEQQEWMLGPELQGPRICSCVLDMGNDSYAIIGGAYTYKNLEIIDLAKGESVLSNDEALSHHRWGHGCAIPRGSETFLGVVAGGISENFLAVKYTEYFDGVSFTDGPVMSNAREGGHTVTLGDGRVHHLGGIQGLLPHRDVMALDLEAGAWVPVEGRLLEPHVSGASAAVPINLFDNCARKH